MAKQYTTWRDIFAPKIAEVISRYPADCPERRKELREVWPRNEERKYWPYKVYLDEIARQTGKKQRVTRKSDTIAPGHLKLPLD